MALTLSPDICHTPTRTPRVSPKGPLSPQVAALPCLVWGGQGERERGRKGGRREGGGTIPKDPGRCSHPSSDPKGSRIFFLDSLDCGIRISFSLPQSYTKVHPSQKSGLVLLEGGAEQLPKTPNPGKRGLKIPKNPTVPNFPSVPGKSHFPGRAGASPGVFRAIKGSAGMILMIPMGCDQ